MERYNKVVLYDGECGFCSFWVQWLLNMDKDNQLKFASLQGNYGQLFLQDKGLNITDFDTIYFIKDDEYFYEKSTAIIQIVNSLGGIFQLIMLLYIIPRFIRDAVYMIVSKNRKKLINNNCLFPTPIQRKQFID